MATQKCKITFLSPYQEGRYTGDMHFAAQGSAGSRYYVDRIDGLIVSVRISIDNFSVIPNFKRAYTSKQEVREEGQVRLSYRVEPTKGVERIIRAFLGLMSKNSELEKEFMERKILENGRLNKVVGLGMSQEIIDLSLVSGYTLIERILEAPVERLNGFESVGSIHEGIPVTTGRRRGGPYHGVI